MEGISVIISYHNESKTIETTLDLLVNQTFLPNEVLMIDSSSTDDSYDIIQKWIQKNAPLQNVVFRNIWENTNVPGSSMNVGIRNAAYDIFAFMDCELLFENDWLQRQLEYLGANNCAVVSGLCCFEGTNLLDKSAIAQTYGYKRLRSTVPSSLVRKSVFDKTGLFLENRRAGHDVDWVNKLARVRIRREINKNVKIKYNGMNYEITLKGIFLKTIKYAENAIGLRRYYRHHVYGLFLICVLAIYFIKIRFFRPWAYNDYIPLVHIDKLWQYVNIQTALILILLYVIIRGYVIPFLKSRNLRLLYEYPLSILTLPVVGVIIDLGKLIGYIKGSLKYVIGRR